MSKHFPLTSTLSTQPTAGLPIFSQQVASLCGWERSQSPKTARHQADHGAFNIPHSAHGNSMCRPMSPWPKAQEDARPNAIASLGARSMWWGKGMVAATTAFLIQPLSISMRSQVPKKNHPQEGNTHLHLKKKSTSSHVRHPPGPGF